MTVKCISFTDTGERLARRIAAALEGESARCGRDASLRDWTARAFSDADALIFVGAVGIAVRAIAPHIRHKAADPAVVVVDEGGRYAIPILSGHLGGANELARTAAALCGGEAVITTATDVNGVFAVDEWARRQNCAIPNPERIKLVSSKLLAGQTVFYHSDWPIPGRPPQGVAPAEGTSCDFRLSVRRCEVDSLFIVPRIAVLGVGCKRGTAKERIEEAFAALLEQTGLWEQAFVKVCSIDLKQDEAGILDFCRGRSLPFETYSAQSLNRVAGSFSASGFVAKTTGVDNVCERSAVLGSGGVLIQKKWTLPGVTMAAALGAFAPDWRQHG